ncbi:MAG: uracil-xanthine permease family protein [Dethiobacteria bacterium]|jgi:xanthine/uracil permease
MEVKYKYGLDEVPPLSELVFLGLQWLAIIVPIVVIMGNIVAGLHFNEPAGQITYIQKMFFITGISLLVQLLWGHRLPLVVGPATILLIGIVSGRGSGFGAVYTAMALGGLVLFLLSVAGLFNHLKKLFTAPVVATILIMVAFTLSPMILNLITPPAAPGQYPVNICFVLAFVLGIFGVSRHVTGFWKSTLIMWALVGGTAIYCLLFPQEFTSAAAVQDTITAGFLLKTGFNLSFEPGAILSFLVCFQALAINDLGSIYSVGGLLKPEGMAGRVSRGLSLTGILNVLAGLGGVIGPVSFSLSPGVIASTGCASRFALVPAGIILLAISFLPPVIAFLGAIPAVVVGGVFIYIMCSQKYQDDNKNIRMTIKNKEHNKK